MTDIIIALITSGLTLAGTIITVRAGQKKQSYEIRAGQEKQQAEITRQLSEHNRIQDERLKTLSDRVEKHNKVIERTFILEGKVESMNNRISDITNRLNGGD